MKRLILLVALVMAMAVLAPAAFADDTKGVDTAAEMEEEKDPSAAQLWKAQMIADYYLAAGDEADQDQVDLVMDLRLNGTETVEHSMGWGVLSKLAAWAVAMDTDIVGVLALAPSDDGGYALGQIRKLYLADRGAEDGIYGELPYKNFGQLQKSYKDMPTKAEKPGKPDKVKPDKAPKKDKNDG